MPGLYSPFRASSSNASASRPAGAPLGAAPAASSCRHLQGVPPPRSLLPAFHTSSKRVLGTETPQPIFPKEVMIPEDCRTHGNSSLNYCSSGSLHLRDPSSMCLAAMVHTFLEEEEEDEEDEEEEQQKVCLSGSSGCGRARCNCVDNVCGAEAGGDLEEDAASDRQIEQLCEILEGYTCCVNSLLLKEVGKAIEELTMQEYIGTEKISGTDTLRRTVMTRLRTAGYNAGACKSRWNHGDGLSAGDYEYIDVVMNGKDGKEVRVIVDINFRAQFEIARPSSEYTQMLKVVPTLYVGRAERIKAIVRMMSQASKRSLKAQGLTTPPWRRHRYMQAKWLSPIYRRTTNMEPARSISQTSVKKSKQEGINMLLSSAGTPGDLKFDGASKNLGAIAKFNQKGTKWADENRILMKRDKMDVVYRRPAMNVLEKGGSTISVMCTSWQLPSLKEKHSMKGPLVSALSFALQE